MSVQIHGKEYQTVAERLKQVHDIQKLTSVRTEILNHDPVVIKATVILGGNEFTGISSVSLEASKMIEKSNPYEVAETSAVGRALAFGGYAGSEFPSVEEMNKSEASMNAPRKTYDLPKTTAQEEIESAPFPESEEKSCSVNHEELPTLTVKKEGKNQGKQFITCKQCNYFKWM